MKLVIACVLLFVLAALENDCATTGNPCIGTAAQRQTMPCTCPGTLDPACYPFPSDAKRPDAGADR